MKMLFLFYLLVIFLSFQKLSQSVIYKPNWESLDSRALPLWYDESKFGIFMHWGLYSVPSYGSGVTWFWWYWQGMHYPGQVDFMKKNYRPGFTYADFGPQFTAEFFDPDRFAQIIKSSGAKYFVLISKHHEGFTMWPSNYSWNWNSVDLGPKRDIVGDIRQSILKLGGVHFGLYFSQFEWFNRLYKKDKSQNFTSQEYVSSTSLPQMYELIKEYQPDVLWSDGDWEAPDTYWNSTQFLAWLYNYSPVKDSVVTNDRWGKGTSCKHGGFWNCHDKFSPGKLVPHKWENCMTTDANSWGFSRSMTYGRVLSIEQLIEKLASTIRLFGRAGLINITEMRFMCGKTPVCVICGGNLLLNVGPTHDGRIVPIFEERLAQMGQFLKVNGEAVYGTKPWIYQNDTITPNIWYTSNLRSSLNSDPYRLFNPQVFANTVVYAFVLQWPENGKLQLGAPKPTPSTKVTMLGYPDRIKNDGELSDGLMVDLRSIPWTKLPNTWAWVLKLEYLQSEQKTPDMLDVSSVKTDLHPH